jgi:hypothetical protein
MKLLLARLLGGLLGFCAAGAGWFFAGAWYTRRVGEKYPPAGDLGMPSPEAFDAGMITLVGTPFAAVIGAAAGVFLVSRVGRRVPRNGNEPR